MTDRDHKRRYVPQLLTDVITGEEFLAKAHNHYEDNNGVPAAPEIELPRLSTRERVELLTRGGFNLHDTYARQVRQEPDDELDILDDTDSDDPPITRDEHVYLAQVAEREEETRQALEAAAKAAEPPPAPPSPQVGGGVGAAQAPATAPPEAPLPAPPRSASS